MSRYPSSLLRLLPLFSRGRGKRSAAEFSPREITPIWIEDRPASNRNTTTTMRTLGEGATISEQRRLFNDGAGRFWELERVSWKIESLTCSTMKNPREMGKRKRKTKRVVVLPIRFGVYEQGTNSRQFRLGIVTICGGWARLSHS